MCYVDYGNKQSTDVHHKYILYDIYFTTYILREVGGPDGIR